MKKIISLLTLIIILSCNSTKKVASNTATTTAATTSTTAQSINNNMKAMLIDGTWEVDYMTPQTKDFQTLFPNKRPTITFNSAKNEVSGNAGCNNFFGSMTLENKNIKFGRLGTTRKMCPENMDGEAAFLKILEGVTSYSVSDKGMVLNLIIGDIAVIRANRK